MQKMGAYILTLQIRQPIALVIGALGQFRFPAGRYLYVGSAARGIEQRIARHRRLAQSKTGKKHWHIDFLLTHPKVDLVRTHALERFNECDVSSEIASMKGINVPVPRFGSTDCRAGCAAHLYRIRSWANLEKILTTNSLKPSDTTSYSFFRRIHHGQDY
jgi:Uri superfamily endonuclease